MNNKNWLLAIAVCALAGQASAQGKASVWRYVDGGHVSYSNVPIKGKKGEKVQMMTYPAAQPRAAQYEAPAEQGQAIAVSAPGGAAMGAAIPAELLRQIKTTGGKPPLPPMGLPPLPAMPGAVALPKSVAPSVSVQRAATPRASSAPVLMAQEEPAPTSPLWARERPAQATQSPSWARDPFSN